MKTNTHTHTTKYRIEVSTSVDSGSPRLSLPETSDAESLATTATSKSATSKSAGGPQKKGKKDHCACKVCGLKFADMPAGFPYCYTHKSDYESCFGALKEAVRQNPNEVQIHEDRLKEFEKLRDKAGAPPTEFSSWVLKYAQACPAEGRGRKRKLYDYATEQETKTAASRTKVGVKAVKMHKEKYLRLAVNDLDMCPEDAEANWDNYEKVLVSEKNRDMLGPPQSRLRLNIPVEDYTLGENEVEHAKRVVLESARKKIKAIGEIEQMQDRRPFCCC